MTRAHLLIEKAANSTVKVTYTIIKTRRFRISAVLPKFRIFLFPKSATHCLIYFSKSNVSKTIGIKNVVEHPLVFIFEI